MKEQDPVKMGKTINTALRKELIKAQERIKIVGDNFPNIPTVDEMREIISNWL